MSVPIYIFKYEARGNYNTFQGVVLAKNRREARELVLAFDSREKDDIPDIEHELVITRVKDKIIDFSWCL